MKKTRLLTTESNDHSYYRTLMKALKIGLFTWILVGNGSHAYKILWALPEFSYVLTFLTAKIFSEPANISSEDRDVCKSRF